MKRLLLLLIPLLLVVGCSDTSDIEARPDAYESAALPLSYPATPTTKPTATPTATATATAAPIVFVDRNWSVLTTPVSYYVSVATGVGTALSRNGIPMLLGRAYCSYDSPSLNWGQKKNGSLNIIGVGTGDCYGWSVEGIATEGRRWIPNTHIEVLEFVDQNWTSFSLSTKVVNAEVGGQGNSTVRNAAQLLSDCSYDSPVLGEYPQTSPALVIGKGTGICTGWYVVATRSQNVWLHGSKLQAFAASVATASPAPTQAPTTSPSPTASPSPEPTYRHLNGDRIPATTDAGTDTCDARFLETAFCIELLPYTGITAEHLQKTVDGLQAIVGRYPVSKSELKVDWPNFGPSGGYQSYLGVVMWHVEQSDNNRVITDLCRFQMVVADYNAKCSAKSTELMGKRATGGATTSPGDMEHNGYLIIASNALMDEPISPAPSPTNLYFKDPRKVMAHEYFHAYQLSHAVRMSGGSDGAGFDKDGVPLDGVTNVGPYWLIEGTAEYAAVRVSSLEGWMDWDDQLRVRMLIALQFLADYPNLSIEDNVTPAQHANNFALSPAVGQVLTYELAVWAAAYAISISSHDAVMVNYWDDLEQYGYEQSFEKNIGMSFDEFYQSFNEFRQKTIDEQMTVVSGQIKN